MKIRLGYACLNKTLDLKFHNITYTNYKKTKNRNEKLNQIILENFETLKTILKFNIKNNISFYRMTSNLIPLGTKKEVHFEIFKRYKKQFEEIGKIIKDNNLRVDLHVDPYVVLNSLNDDIVSSSINILKFYQKMFKTMKIKSFLIMHIGSSMPTKELAIQRFIQNFNLLDKKLQKIIVLENDDKTYNIVDTLNLCEILNIPMVLDYHHYLCNRKKEKLDDYIDRIFKTWTLEKPKIHFSSPKSNKEKRSHHDYIEYNKFIYFLDNLNIDKDFDIMIEAKAKDEALFKLIKQLDFKSNYKIKKNTIFYK